MASISTSLGLLHLRNEHRAATALNNIAVSLLQRWRSSSRGIGSFDHANETFQVSKVTGNKEYLAAKKTFLLTVLFLYSFLSKDALFLMKAVSEGETVDAREVDGKIRAATRKLMSATFASSHPNDRSADDHLFTVVPDDGDTSLALADGNNTCNLLVRIEEYGPESSSLRDIGLGTHTS